MGFGIKLIDGISQANDQGFKVLAGKDVDLTEASDFGGALADADLILVDDAAAGTQASTKKSALSRVWTYIQAKIAGTANIIDSDQYVDGSIDTVHIADDQVTEAKLANSLLAEIDANTAKATNVATDLTATANGTSLTINSSDGSNVALPAATNSAWGIMSDDLVVALEANTAKNTNVVGNLSATANGTSLTVETANGSNVALPAADTDNWGVMTDEMFDAIAVNTSKATNVDTDLTATANGTSLTINSSDGDNVALPAATNSAWGIMSDDHVVALEANTAKTTFPGFGTSGSTALVGNTALLALGTSSSTALAGNTALLALGTSGSTALAGNTTTISGAQASAITANTAKTGITSGQASAIAANTNKVTNATHTGDVTGATTLTIGTGKVITAMILDDNVTADKLANSINSAIAANTSKTGITSGQASAITANTAKTGITSGQSSAITANTAKTSFSNLTGEVTSSGAATTISDGVVDEANLKVSNDPTDGHVLSAQSGNTGGLTWVAAGSGGTDVSLAGSRDYITISGQEITRNAIDLTADVTGVLPSANLPTNTAYLSGAQNFTGAKVFSAGITPSFIKHSISGNNAAEYGPGADILYGIGDDSVTAGAIYVLRGDTTGWVLMNAALASSSRQLCAVATVAAGNGNSSDGMLIRGCVTLAAGIVGTDIEGHQIYASTTAGYAAIAPPTASGNGIRVLGYSLNVGSKKIFFDPDKTWLEI